MILAFNRSFSVLSALVLLVSFEWFTSASPLAAVVAAPTSSRSSIPTPTSSCSQSLRMLGSLSIPVSDFDLIDHFAYVAANDFYIVDVQNPSQPVIHSYLPSSAINSGNQGLTNVQVVGQTAYGLFNYLELQGKGLALIDVSNATVPTLVSETRITTPTVTVEDFRVNAEFLYVATGGGILPDSFRLIELSDPQNPTLLSSSNLPSGRFVIKDSFAYVAASTNGLEIVDLQDPRALRTLSTTPTPLAARYIEVQGERAYVLTTDRTQGSSELLVFDISRPQEPGLVGRYSTDGYASDLVVHNHCAYVLTISGENVSRLDVVNVQAEILPRRERQHILAAGSKRIELRNNQMYVGSGQGLQIMEFVPDQVWLPIIVR